MDILSSTTISSLDIVSFTTPCQQTTKRNTGSLPEEKNISEYAEQIANDKSGLVADVGASKHTWKDVGNKEKACSSNNPAKKQLSLEFRPYAEVCNLL